MQEERFTSRLKLGRGVSCHRLNIFSPQQPHRRSVSLEIKDAINHYAAFENIGSPVLDLHTEELQMDMKSATQIWTLPQHRRIRALRRQLEISQLEVAQYAGISQSQYSLFEQGYVRLPSEIIQGIEGLLNWEASKENGNG